MKVLLDPWIGGALVVPLILFFGVKAFHRNPELFGINTKPQSATAAIAQPKPQAIPPRDELLKRAAACEYSAPISKVDDKTLNNLVAECEATKPK